MNAGGHLSVSKGIVVLHLDTRRSDYFFIAPSHTRAHTQTIMSPVTEPVLWSNKGPKRRGARKSEIGGGCIVPLDSCIFFYLQQCVCDDIYLLSPCFHRGMTCP